MPLGKPAGVRCVQLDDANRCRIFGQATRPAVCGGLQPSPEMCGNSAEQAIHWLTQLEQATTPRREGEGWMPISAAQPP